MLQIHLVEPKNSCYDDDELEKKKLQLVSGFSSSSTLTSSPHDEMKKVIKCRMIFAFHRFTVAVDTKMFN